MLIDTAGQLGTISSSRRVKDDIADMGACSSGLMTLRPVTFHYKSDKSPSGRTLQYGLIAEEVAEVYPGLVAHSADGQIETVMYQFLPPMLLNEVQKQQRTIDTLRAAVETGKAQMQARDEQSGNSASRWRRWRRPWRRSVSRSSDDPRGSRRWSNSPRSCTRRVHSTSIEPPPR